MDAFYPVLEDGRLELYFYDDTDGGLGPVDPADVLMVVKPEAVRVVPPNPDFAFLGREGDDVWILPQTAEAGLLWPGLSTEALEGRWQGGQIRLRLTAIETPEQGRFVLYEIGGFQEVNILWQSDDLDASSFTVSTDVHAHMNWAFTRPGIYVLTVEACGNHTGPDEPLGQVCSRAVAYTIEVEAEESAASPATDGASDRP